jgi:hypothetical protein
MAEEKKEVTMILQWAQLVVLLLGVTGFFVDIGKRSQLLDRTNQDLG